MNRISRNPEGGRKGFLVPFELLLALGSGVLLILSFPKFGVGCVAWISLLPLLHALNGKKPAQGFLLGLTTGLTSQIGVMYWIVHVVVNYGYLPYPVGIAAMLLLSGYLGLYTGVFAAATTFLRGWRLPLCLTAPALWTTLEYGKSHLLTGFPWENLGYSQYLNLPILQLADIAGVYGLSFLIVLVNVLIFEAAFIHRGKEEKKGRLVRIVAVLGIMALGTGYGLMRLQEIDRTAPASTLTVRIAQGNVDQSVKWNPAYQRETIATYAALSMAEAAARPALVVWPETAYPAFFQEDDGLHREVVALVKDRAAWFLIGSPAFAIQRGETALFNSAFLLTPEGAIAGRYDKVHLVPYGEYVPLRDYFPFINKLVAGIGDFGVGPGYYPLKMNDRRLGVLICYEGIFPAASRDYKRRGADFLVNITNDAWFGRTSAPYQHLSMTVFRAVENRLDVVRAANTGISARIDAAGRIDGRMDLFQTGFQDIEIRCYDKGTFYAAWGDVLVYPCIAAVASIFIVMPIRRKRDAGRNE
ncbi:MAG: apolipoprotein N-acyltransferase [Pseudomonadota bacterium]|nr:apolipoprotein N-acyltransferase [Pseudomonadota bacterium]